MEDIQTLTKEKIKLDEPGENYSRTQKSKNYRYQIKQSG
jgi:hypothetical protein